MSADLPKAPPPLWARGLEAGDRVRVIDPVPLRVVYEATVDRVTPSGLIRLRHDSGNPGQTFRAEDGYIRGAFKARNFWPRFIAPLPPGSRP